uniref:SH2 domain-containing protein n=1 Tax=Neolamprologus brichardi TaxID=32507 RepID=A0A3Q4GJW4_NEOBR
MATAAWYHRDISRVYAEDLLARAGRDGSYLVRDSENMFVFRLCKDSVTTAVTLLFEWHLCHVAACLQHELSSTEEKLF